MKKIAVFFSILFLVATQVALGQLEASNWYFGNNAGIQFDPNSGEVTALTNGVLQTPEGCSTISDGDGNLLFYTDGILVYDRLHKIMQNGAGLRGNPSSAQSGIIIPKPGNPNIYYIFTVDTRLQNNSPTGMHYYEVDMSLNGGLGAVTTNISNPPNLLRDCSEKIAAVNAGNGTDILVVAYANAVSGLPSGFDTFYTYKVTPAGVVTTPVKSTFPAKIQDRRGNLKISADGSRMVSANMQSGTYIYNFDVNTGLASNERQLNLPFPNFAGYGVEFSPSNGLLYISSSNDYNGDNADNPSLHTSSVFQYDLSLPDISQINNTRIELYNGLGYRGALQLGINGKIYRALSDSYNLGSQFLGVINNPDVKGRGARYIHDAVALQSRISRQGLPPFIQSFFAVIDVDNVCLGDDTTFSFESDDVPTSILWDFGDGTTSSVRNPTHRYSSPGIYQVGLTLDFAGSIKNFFKQIEIFDTPVANQPMDVALCDQGNDGREPLDLIETTMEVLGTQDPSVFTVNYYPSLIDAQNDENLIELPLILATGSKTLYARVNNISNSDCFETTSFTATIYDQPTANPVMDLVACDDNSDGIINFNLNGQDSSILGIQDPNVFNVTYYRNQVDAELRQNQLPFNYQNSTPFLETIVARVDNKLENSCQALTQFDLIVQERPIAQPFTGFQCDEDGTPDRITNFNLSSFDSSISNNDPNVVVTYYSNQNDAINNNAPLDNRNYRNISPLQTIYTRVTNTVNGCFDTSTLVLNVSASDAQNTTLLLCDDDGTIDGLQTFDLSLANDEVLKNAPVDVTLNYYLTLNDALSEINALDTMFTNNVPNQQVVFARAESPDGNCYGISEVRLVVNMLPNLQEEEFVEYCGNDPQPLTINAGMLDGDVTDYTYQWNNGAESYAIDVRTGGEYEVIVNNASGCSSKRTVTVVISEPATISSIDVNNANGSTYGSAIINVNGLGAYEYRLDSLATYQESANFEDLKPGFYQVFVNDKNGCGEVIDKFSIVGYPRFFTPNGDGFNDFWQLDGVDNIIEPDAQIYIFDRYGKLLKKLNPGGTGWDGTFNGQPLPSSDYWFKATLTDGTVFSANFSLKR